MNAVPASGGFTGWVYTTESTWRQFGLISTSDAETNLVVDGVFANGEVVGYAGSFTNLNVTGIGRSLMLISKVAFHLLTLLLRISMYLE